MYIMQSIPILINLKNKRKQVNFIQDWRLFFFESRVCGNVESNEEYEGSILCEVC